MPEPQEYLSKFANDDGGKLPSREEVMKFFVDNPTPTDKQFHAFCERKGFNVHKAEAEAYKMAASFARFWLGGRSNEKGAPIKYDPKALAMGVKVEYEHMDFFLTMMQTRWKAAVCLNTKATHLKSDPCLDYDQYRHTKPMQYFNTKHRIHGVVNRFS